MSRFRRGGRAVATVAAAAVLLLGAVPAAAGHARTRPGAGPSTGTAGPRVVGATAGAARTAVRVAGQARYGYGYGGRSVSVVGWGAWPWWYGGSAFDVGLWWGWPVYGGWYPVSYPYPAWTAAPDGVPGLVETDVRPRRAGVWLDGVFVGQARDFSGRWDALYLEPGVHELRFERDGYRTLTVHVDVRAGATHHVDFALVKGAGADPRSSERPVGIAAAPPVDQRAAGLATGVEGAADRPSPAAGALRTGRLRIDARPDDAAVYLDGEFLAPAGELARLHGALPVAAGEHTVEVVRPGYETARRIVVVDAAGEVAVVEVRLLGGGE